MQSASNKKTKKNNSEKARVKRPELKQAKSIGQGRAKLAVISCWVFAAMGLVNMGVNIWLSGLASMEIYLEQKEFASFIAAPTIVTHVACAVLFLMWFHRAHLNLSILGEEGLRFTPNWAVASFLVPILFFFMPFQVMGEVFYRSQEEGVNVSKDNEPNPVWISIWWFLYLVSWLAPAALNQGITSNYGMEHYDLLSLISATGSFLQVAGLMVAVKLVRIVQNLQEARFDKLIAIK
jgi:hypothetical protein